MDKFNELLLTKDSLGMEEILRFAHNIESPILSYNNEIELSVVVNVCYLSARNKYRVEREEKAGKGFVDFAFILSGEKGTASFWN